MASLSSVAGRSEEQLMIRRFVLRWWTSEAEAEYQVVSDAEKNTPEDVVFAMPVHNKAKDVLKIGRDVLGAKIALAKKDNAGAIALLQSAMAVQDLKYSEPEDWFFPVRESLGAALLMNGDKAGAEKVFREDLDLHPRNPRSLYGLQQALKAQGKEYDAGLRRWGPRQTEHMKPNCLSRPKGQLHIEANLIKLSLS